MQLRTVIPAVFNKIKPGATFMSVKGYTNNYDEVSNFGLVFHVNYMNAVRKAVEAWSFHNASTKIEQQAKDELIESYLQTLSGHNPNARSAHAYSAIVDGKLKTVQGVKFHDKESAVHLWGFLLNKKILSGGSYPTVTSSPLTIAKKSLMRLTPLSRFRQFKLVEGRFSSIGVQKLNLTQADLLRYI